MHHFIVPQYTPKTLQELPPEPDEVTSLVYLEDSIAKELNSIREHCKDARPLGQVPHEEDLSEVEEEANGGSTPGSNERSSDFQDDDDNNGAVDDEAEDDDEMVV